MRVPLAPSTCKAYPYVHTLEYPAQNSEKTAAARVPSFDMLNAWNGHLAASYILIWLYFYTRHAAPPFAWKSYMISSIQVRSIYSRVKVRGENDMKPWNLFTNSIYSDTECSCYYMNEQQNCELAS